MGSHEFRLIGMADVGKLVHVHIEVPGKPFRHHFLYSRREEHEKGQPGGDPEGNYQAPGMSEPRKGRARSDIIPRATSM